MQITFASDSTPLMRWHTMPGTVGMPSVGLHMYVLVHVKLMWCDCHTICRGGWSVWDVLIARVMIWNVMPLPLTQNCVSKSHSHNLYPKLFHMVWETFILCSIRGTYVPFWGLSVSLCLCIEVWRPWQLLASGGGGEGSAKTEGHWSAV